MLLILLSYELSEVPSRIQIRSYCSSCVIFLLLLLFLFNLKEARQRHLQSTGSLPKCLQQTSLGQDQVRSWELNLGLPGGWHGPMYCSHHLLSPKGCISRKPGSNPGALLWDTGVSNSILTGAPNTHLALPSFECASFFSYLFDTILPFRFLISFCVLHP